MKNRKNLLLGCFVASLLCAGFAVSGLNHAAKAEVTVDSVGFTMNDTGAKVREDGLGIRFSATMSASDYADLKAAYDEVSFGVIIMPAQYQTLYGTDEAHFFGDDAVYYWAQGAGYNVAETEGKHEVLQMDSLAVEEGDLVKVNGSIVEIQPQNKTLDFIGIPYVVGTKDSVEDIRLATISGDCAVNLVESAQNSALAGDEYADVYEGIVTDYIKEYEEVNGVKPAAKYTVNTYVNGELQSSVEERGDLNEIVTATPDPDKTLASGSVLSGKVMFDGSLVLSICYDMPTYESAEKFVIETSRGAVAFDDDAFEGTVKSLSYEGMVLNAVDGKFVSGGAIIPTAKLGEGKKAIVETSKAFYTVSIDVYTMIIRDKTDLDNFGAVAYAQSEANNLWDGYFVLGGNIDYNDNWEPFFLVGAFPGSGDWSFNGFVGIFDGKGFNIDGLSTMPDDTVTGKDQRRYRAFIQTLSSPGVIRNVSFTNAIGGQAGFLVNNGNGGLVENVYIHCTAQQGGYLDSFFFGWNVAQDRAYTVKNCVVDVDAKSGDGHILNWNTTASATVQNVYAIGSGLNAHGGKVGVYATYRDFANAGKVSGWSDFWTTENGFPYPAKLTRNGSVPTATAPAGGIRVGESGTITGLGKHDLVKLEENIAGVSLSGATVNVGDNVPVGTIIPVTVYSAVDATKAQVLMIEVIAGYYESAEKFVIETSRGEVAFDDDAFEGDVKSLTYEGVVFNAVDGKFVSSGAIIPTAKLGEGKEAIVETSSAFYTVTIDIYTMVIRDKTDLDAFGAVAYAQNAATSKWDGYFVLGNNIDYNDKWTPFFLVGQYPGSIDWNSDGFVGIFDGKGFNIDGLSTAAPDTATTNDHKRYRSFIQTLSAPGVIRNVSFTNAISNETGFLVNSGTGGLIENVYIHCAQQGGYVSSFFYGWNGGGSRAYTVRNCVVKVDVKGTGHILNWSTTADATIQNVYAIGSGLSNHGGKVGVYASASALGGSGIDFSGWSDFWTLKDGAPYPAKLAARGL